MTKVKHGKHSPGDRWTLADREWAQLLLAETQADIERQLMARFPDDPNVVRRAPRLTKDLVSAMIRSSRGIFDAVQRSTSPNDLREVRLNLRAVVPELRSKIQPPDLADFMAEVLLDAASPDDPFGDELLGKIVAGQVLHGMVCRKDVVGTDAISPLGPGHKSAACAC